MRKYVVVLCMLWVAGCGSREPELSQCAGRYGLDELGLWREQARALQGTPGVVSVGLHPVLDCLAVGMTDSSFVGSIEAQLQQLGIPRDAVVISEEEVEAE